MVTIKPGLDIQGSFKLTSHDKDGFELRLCQKRPGGRNRDFATSHVVRLTPDGRDTRVMSLSVPGGVNEEKTTPSEPIADELGIVADALGIERFLRMFGVDPKSVVNNN